jgi:ribonucleotide reductase beta subunit family protein with ferritin-like domain
MATKFVYTDSEIKEIVHAYSYGASLETLADRYNKSVASVRMKLVKLGVYVAKKTASKAPTKTEINTEFEQAYRANGPALI